ncbi:hypothetical protein E1264_38050 [Actinomadura sp. KC216]|uniref:hypothetical protein n=1 Tax=Actinomadura sp. KC216 TaxID=2530370 RepID=UPI001051154D|nr:hypothetical protein [Actinomadura sp. KC216]TDB76793.1 hypothetical protein E1264_38050 [Actinomadura sp. KC216]
MAPQNPENEIIEQVSAEIVNLARALIDLIGLPEDAALDLAVDMVLSELAAHAPRVLCAYRRAMVAQHPEILAHLN